MIGRMDGRFAREAGVIRDRAARLAAVATFRPIRITRPLRALAQATRPGRGLGERLRAVAMSPSAAERLPSAGVPQARAANGALAPIVAARALAGTARIPAPERAPGSLLRRPGPGMAAQIMAPARASTLGRRREPVAALSAGIVRGGGPDPGHDRGHDRGHDPGRGASRRPTPRSALARSTGAVAARADPGGGIGPSIPGLASARMQGALSQEGGGPEPAPTSGTTLVLAGELVIDGHKLGQLLASGQARALTASPRGSRALNLRAVPVAASLVPPLP